MAHIDIDGDCICCFWVYHYAVYTGCEYHKGLCQQLTHLHDQLEDSCRIRSQPFVEFKQKWHESEIRRFFHNAVVHLVSAFQTCLYWVLQCCRVCISLLCILILIILYILILIFLYILSLLLFFIFSLLLFFISLFVLFLCFALASSLCCLTAYCRACMRPHNIV